jgi:hypothetical protein
MDISQSLDHYENRRDLLRGYLSEYGLLQFSFAYYRISEQTGGVERLESMLERVRRILPF